MKKIILFSVVLFLAGLNMTMAQLPKINSIPTYNYYMTEQTAAFQEQGSGETREKRDITVVITSSGDAIEEVFATIFLFKKDGSQVMGPFTVYDGQPFTQDLPKGKWGVTVNCSWDVSVSVWISTQKFVRENEER